MTELPDNILHLPQYQVLGCKSTDDEMHFQVDVPDPIACEECGLLRTDPMPTEEELAAYYASEYRRDYQLAFGKAQPASASAGITINARTTPLKFIKPS